MQSFRIFSLIEESFVACTQQWLHLWFTSLSKAFEIPHTCCWGWKCKIRTGQPWPRSLFEGTTFRRNSLVVPVLSLTLVVSLFILLHVICRVSHLCFSISSSFYPFFVVCILNVLTRSWYYVLAEARCKWNHLDINILSFIWKIFGLCEITNGARAP